MILYFSATGNSKYVAERIAEATEDAAVSIENAERDVALEPGEHLGIITPVYFGGISTPMRDFLLRLRLTGDAGYCFCVLTYGYTSGFSAAEVRRLVSRKGLRLSASFGVQMPDTWTPMFNLSDSAAVSRTSEAAEEKIDSVIDSIRGMETGARGAGRYPYVARLVARPLYDSARRTGNLYVENACIGCGLCERRCPVQAIEMADGRPVWTKGRCALCLRCLHHCPKFAIQYGNGATKRHGQYQNPHVKV